jgi:hypothetical protein
MRRMRRLVIDFLEDAVFIRTHGRRIGYGIRTTIYFLVVSCATIAALWSYLRPAPPLPSNDFHMWTSLDLGINHSFCGRTGLVSSRFPIAEDLNAHRNQRHVPLRSMLIGRAGSIAAYCSTVTTPVVNHENSLQLLFTAYARLDPQVSLARLGYFLHALRLLCLLLLVFILLANGASLTLSATTLGAGLLMLHALDGRVISYRYSVYAFLHVLPLVAVAFYTFAISRRLSGRALPHLAVTAAAGFYSAFGSNMRTSHTPVYVTIFALYLFAAFRQCRCTLWWKRWFGLGIAGFVAGYAAFMAALLMPLLPPENLRTVNYHYHAVAHSVVMGLATGHSPLAQQEGIAWADSATLPLARRMNPGATFLGPDFERSLMLYYLDLWRREPHAMLSLYWDKLLLAGRDYYRGLREMPLLGVMAWPLRFFSNGLMLLGLFGFVLVSAWVAFERSGNPLAFALAAAGMIALLLHIEAILIMSMFVIRYQCSQLFFLAVFGMVCYQTILEGARFGGRRLYARYRGASAGSPG